MTPTNYLRFVVRKEIYQVQPTDKIQPGAVSIERRVLRQFYEHEGGRDAVYCGTFRPSLIGFWKDVPIEQED